MAKQQQATMTGNNPVNKMQAFLGEVRTELDKVTWPTYEDLKVSTKVCVMLLGIMAVITFGFDKVFNILVLGLLSLAS